MKSLLIVLQLLTLSTFIWGQKAQPQIEVTPYLRYDSYPEFTYSFNSVTSNRVTIQGLSWGINSTYKHPLSKTVQLKAGISYYRYSFNDINAYNSRWGKSETRLTNYVSDVYAMFFTKRYWYHCLGAHIGADKVFALKNNIDVVGGISLTNYYTFSQYYHINYDYPYGPPNHKYHLNKFRNFAYSAGLHAGLLKQIGKVTVGPVLSLPVYDSWKKDAFFVQTQSSSENSSESRSKWLGGISAGITFKYPLGNK